MYIINIYLGYEIFSFNRELNAACVKLSPCRHKASAQPTNFVGNLNVRLVILPALLLHLPLHAVL